MFESRKISVPERKVTVFEPVDEGQNYRSRPSSTLPFGRSAQELGFIDYCFLIY